MRRSLGDYPPPPAKLNTRVTGTLDGDGFRIENVVYESRPGQWVTGNLYVPAKPAQSMPGILLAHAHHRDKPQSELQDMGMTWSRAGCLVLVIDQVGYGERRAHPFHRDEDYAKPYRTTRQDYYFRYDSGVQLQLLGDSLMGWMAWDLMRGVDLLLAREGIDPQRIILLGAVAGGGDPAAVTAALDRRIACCVPFNFGGPQPETRYPLPEDAERSFDLLGGTYWDSTRGLRLGGRDDFLHWVIVASTAPRRLIHAHEFSWDRDRDPVWKRYQQVWGQFYNAADNIGFAHGYGTLRQQAAQGIALHEYRPRSPPHDPSAVRTLVRHPGRRVGRIQFAAQTRGTHLSDRQGTQRTPAEKPDRGHERDRPGANRSRTPTAGRQVGCRTPATSPRRLEQASRPRDPGRVAGGQGDVDGRPAGRPARKSSASCWRSSPAFWCR